MKKALTLILLVSFFKTASSQTTIQASEANMHIGDSVTVIEKVYGAILLKSGLALLNIGGDHPNQPLVLMIKAPDRTKFSFKPEVQLKGKYILVSGKLVDYKGKPQIVITDPKQIEQLSAKDSRINLKKLE